VVHSVTHLHAGASLRMVIFFFKSSDILSKFLRQFSSPALNIWVISVDARSPASAIVMQHKRNVTSTVIISTRMTAVLGISSASLTY
jgi:hypothetical protein